MNAKNSNPRPAPITGESPHKGQAPEALRAHFEALASDPSFKLSHSRRGTYVNPAVARDWKWFQLGASQAQQTAPAGATGCDTPNYCGSVQRCTAQDEQRSKPAPKQGAQEPAFWMNEKGHTWSHGDWKQFPKHRAKYPIPLYPHSPAPQPSTAQAASQEPVAYVAFAENGNIRLWSRNQIRHPDAQPLYTHPSQQPAHLLMKQSECDALSPSAQQLLTTAAATQPAATGGAVDALPDEKSCVDYVLQYGGRCRDCADENGVCPGSGLPCEGARKAVTHVVQALRYGLQHGYLRADQVEVKP